MRQRCFFPTFSMWWIQLRKASRGDPPLRRGELPTPVRLGTKLRSLRGRNFGGRAIEGGRGNRGVVWTVEAVPPDLR